jgi:hypothetical protein
MAKFGFFQCAFVLPSLRHQLILLLAVQVVPDAHLIVAFHDSVSHDVYEVTHGDQCCSGRRHSCVDARTDVPPATDSVQESFMPRYF